MDTLCHGQCTRGQKVIWVQESAAVSGGESWTRNVKDRGEEAPTPSFDGGRALAPPSPELSPQKTNSFAAENN